MWAKFVAVIQSLSRISSFSRSCRLACSIAAVRSVSITSTGDSKRDLVDDGDHNGDGMDLKKERIGQNVASGS